MRSLSRATAIRLCLALAGTAALARRPAGAAAPSGLGVPASEALARLVAGNRRYVAGALTNQDGITERRAALTGHQAPFATILSCSDSRVPPELVFDQSVGDLFIIRNAGEVVDDVTLGSSEYGFSNLASKLILVLGHESCGAVSATYDALKTGRPLAPHLDAIYDGIRAGIAPVAHANGSKNEASVANARAQAARLSGSSALLRQGAAKGDLEVVPAYYHLSSGKVEILAFTAHRDRS